MKLGPFGVVLVCIISYLAYHAIAGDQGLSRWTEMQARAATLEKSYQDRIERRDELTRQIHRLYDEYLDDDYLEELARTKFHYVRDDEFMLEAPTLTAQLPENEELFELSK